MDMSPQYPLILKKANNEFISFENRPLFNFVIFATLTVVFITFFIFVVQPMPPSTDKTLLHALFSIFICVGLFGSIKAFFTRELLMIDKSKHQIRYSYTALTKKTEWRRRFEEFNKFVATAEHIDNRGQPYTGSGSNYWVFALCDTEGDTIQITRRTLTKTSVKDIDAAQHFTQLVTSYIPLNIDAPWQN